MRLLGPCGPRASGRARALSCYRDFSPPRRWLKSSSVRQSHLAACKRGTAEHGAGWRDASADSAVALLQRRSRGKWVQRSVLCPCMVYFGEQATSLCSARPPLPATSARCISAGMAPTSRPGIIPTEVQLSRCETWCCDTSITTSARAACLPGHIPASVLCSLLGGWQRCYEGKVPHNP